LDFSTHKNFTLCELDLSSSESVKKFVNSLSPEKEFFGLINNAGYAIAGSLEEVDYESIKKGFDVNVLNPILLTKLLLPKIRNQKGVIINITSLLGIKAQAGLGLYSSFKFALEGLTEALKLEMENFGVKVVLIEPGPFQTNFVNRILETPSIHISDYESSSALALKELYLKNNQKRESNLDLIYDAVVSALDKDQTDFRIMVGKFSETMRSKKIDDLQSAKIIE
jgi:short-subunit dehydrogenase